MGRPPKEILRKRGSPLPKQVHRRFIEKIEAPGPDHCWRWTGVHINDHSYPMFYYMRNGKRYQLPVGRLVYRIYYANYIPNDHVVGHTCDHTWCVNPKHIYIVPRHQHFKERWEEHLVRGKYHKVSRAKLSNQQVREIRRRWREEDVDTYTELAEDYPVTPQAIRDVVEERTFKYL